MAARCLKRARESGSDEYAIAHLNEVEGHVRAYCEWVEHALDATVHQAECELAKPSRQRGTNLEEELCSRLQMMIDNGEVMDAVASVLDGTAGTLPETQAGARPKWVDREDEPAQSVDPHTKHNRVNQELEPLASDEPDTKSTVPQTVTNGIAPAPAPVWRNCEDTHGSHSSGSKANNTKKYFEEGVYSVLHEWWAENIENPYPDREERDRLCRATGLTHKQLVDWFANRRKRSRVRAGEENTGPTWREPGGGRWNSQAASCVRPMPGMPGFVPAGMGFTNQFSPSLPPLSHSQLTDASGNLIEFDRGVEHGMNMPLPPAHHNGDFASMTSSPLGTSSGVPTSMPGMPTNMPNFAHVQIASDDC